MFLTSSLQLQSIRKLGKLPPKGLNDGQEHSAKRSSKECLMVQCNHAPWVWHASHGWTSSRTAKLPRAAMPVGTCGLPKDPQKQAALSTQQAAACTRDTGRGSCGLPPCIKPAGLRCFLLDRSPSVYTLHQPRFTVPFNLLPLLVRARGLVALLQICAVVRTFPSQFVSLRRIWYSLCVMTWI